MLTVLLVQGWFKSNSGTLIYMLMPCHIVGFMQVYLCFKWNLTLFRVMVHYGMYGGMLAMVFPETSTLVQKGEVLFFFIEHLQLLLVAPVLVAWGIYSTEGLTDMRYCVYAWVVNMTMALLFHQSLSVALEGNFAMMGCSAGVLPEPQIMGVNMYQMVGLAFSSTMCFTFGKLYMAVLLKPLERLIKQKG